MRWARLQNGSMDRLRWILHQRLPTPSSSETKAAFNTQLYSQANLAGASLSPADSLALNNTSINLVVIIVNLLKRDDLRGFSLKSWWLERDRHSVRQTTGDIGAKRAPASGLRAFQSERRKWGK
jgi:hypothetical protein